jgi:hypothetical protein
LRPGHSSGGQPVVSTLDELEASSPVVGAPVSEALSVSTAKVDDEVDSDLPGSSGIVSHARVKMRVKLIANWSLMRMVLSESGTSFRTFPFSSGVVPSARWSINNHVVRPRIFVR